MVAEETLDPGKPWTTARFSMNATVKKCLDKAEKDFASRS